MEVRIQCPYHLLNLLRCTDFTFCPSQHHYKEPNLGFGVTSPVWDLMIMLRCAIGRKECFWVIVVHAPCKATTGPLLILQCHDSFAN
jgi:hypothetical protein